MNRRMRRSTGIAATAIAVTIAGVVSSTGATATPAAPKPVVTTDSYFVSGSNPTDLAQHDQAALHAADPSRLPGVIAAGKGVVPTAAPQAASPAGTPAGTPPASLAAPGAKRGAVPREVVPRVPGSNLGHGPSKRVQPLTTTGTVTPSVTTGPTSILDPSFYDSCISTPGATSDAGAAISKKQYCRVQFLLLRKLRVNSDNTLTVLGTINARVVMVQGTDSTASNPRTDRGAFGYLRLDEITTSGDYNNPVTILNASVQCVPGTGCVQSGSIGAGRAVSDWQNIANDEADVYSVPAGSGVDTKGFGSVRIRAAASDGSGVAPEAFSLSNQIRCDSATYISRPQGCIIMGVIDEFAMSTGDNNVWESAQNILEGWWTPANTLPVVAGKKVPGRGPEAALWPNGQVRTPTTLHRIYYDTTTQTNNRNLAVNMCKFFWGANYATAYILPRSCDEFPFASTREGAANANGNYVVKVITATDNTNAGRALGIWESNHRILDGDMLYVGIYGTGTPST